MTVARSTIVLLALVAGAFAAVIALAQDNTGQLLINQPVGQDTYAAQREVRVDTEIDGDLVAAGQTVSVKGRVTGDIIVAAQDIEIRSVVDDDVRAAGQHIRVLSPVSGHMVAAGQTVTVAAPISDWAWFAAQTVDVTGDVGGELSIAGDTITINAVVSGNVDVIGESLTIGPNTAIEGNLTWRSENKAEISPDARIDGELIEQAPPAILAADGVGGDLKFTLRLIIAVAILFLLFPRPLRATAERIATRPLASLVIGVAFLATMPVAAVLLFVTGVGLWLGFVVLGIYAVVLLLGMLSGLYSIGDLAVRRLVSEPVAWQMLVAVSVGVAILGLLTYIPWLGVASVFVVWLLGVGALGWNSWLGLRRVSEAASPA